MDDELQEQPLPPPDGWELMCTGILGTEFGRRPSEAAANAVQQLAIEEAEPVARRARLRDWWRSLNPMPRFVFSTACVLAIIAALGSFWFLSAGLRAPTGVCTMTAELDPHWAKGSTHPRAGETLPAGRLQLDSGVIELTFNSKARVAVEGPAEITILSWNSMELASGKLSAQVPKPAHGFFVKTPNVTIVDLGTRFGLNVGADRSARLDVFEGKVRVMTNLESTVSTKPIDLLQNWGATVSAVGEIAKSRAKAETAYPRLGTKMIIHPANCGFDVINMAALGGMPTNFGYWSGSAFEIAGATDAVTPVEGRGMLRFLPAPNRRESEIWQLIDLHKYRSMLTNGDLQLGSFAWFNRVRGGANTAQRFGITVAAYQGKPRNIEQLWTRRHELALTVAEKELDLDNDPATWQKLDVSTALPADANFLILSMRSIAPDDADPAAAFPGDYGDLVDCFLFTPLAPASTGP